MLFKNVKSKNKENDERNVSDAEKRKSHLLIHLLTDAKKHKHVIALCDAHGIKITQHIRTGNSAL